MKTLTSGAGNEYVTIYYEEKTKVVMDVWDGMFGHQENFRKGVLSVIDIIKEKECKYWLADLRNMVGSFDSQKEWIKEEIFPLMMKYGIEKQSIVIPNNIFSKVSANSAILEIGSLKIKQFGEYDPALAWLLS
ncbi:MAG: hypothetical protein AAGI07_11400 [Bacteroidota bacterium]